MLQCPAKGAFQCILPTGHSPFSRDHRHCFGGISPRSVWLPRHKAAEIIRQKERQEDSQPTPADSPVPATQTVVIAIGNSDNILTQAEWSQYCRAVDDLVKYYESNGLFVAIHGVWASDPKSQYQNAAWCMETVPLRGLRDFERELSYVAFDFHQASVAVTVGSTILMESKDKYES